MKTQSLRSVLPFLQRALGVGVVSAPRIRKDHRPGKHGMHRFHRRQDVCSSISITLYQRDTKRQLGSFAHVIHDRGHDQARFPPHPLGLLGPQKFEVGDEFNEEELRLEHTVITRLDSGPRFHFQRTYAKRQPIHARAPAEKLNLSRHCSDVLQRKRWRDWDSQIAVDSDGCITLFRHVQPSRRVELVRILVEKRFVPGGPVSIPYLSTPTALKNAPIVCRNRHDNPSTLRNGDLLHHLPRESCNWFRQWYRHILSSDTEHVRDHRVETEYLLHTGLNERQCFQVRCCEVSLSASIERSFCVMDLLAKTPLGLGVPREFVKTPAERVTRCLVPRKENCPWKEQLVFEATLKNKSYLICESIS